MTQKLTAPVGDKKRITKADKKGEKFKTVANKPADVELVQLMLVANGYSNIKVDGKMTASVINAIRSFQKSSLGFKKPDGIVDPGMRTWKAGLPKLLARIAENERILADRVEITEKGKTKFITKAEFKKRQEEALREMNSKAVSMYNQAEVWLKFCQDAEATMLGQETIMMQLVEFTVRWANAKAEPPYAPLNAASSEAFALRSMTKKGTTPDWARILKQEKKAVAAYNKGVKAFDGFINARIKTASGMVGKLEIVRETSFAVVEAYMTARLVVTKGMAPAKANALAAASTEALKSSAGQFGEWAAGNDVTWEGAIKKVATDTAFAGAAGLIGGKLGDAMATKFVGEFSVKLSAKLAVKYFPKKGAEKFITAFLKSKSGQAFFENAAKETFMLSKTLYEKGKLTRKDFEQALFKAMTAGLLKGGSGKVMETFSKAVPGASQKALDGIIKKGVIKKLDKSLSKSYGDLPIDKVLKDHSDEIIANVIEKVSGKYVEANVLKVLEGAKGTENAKQLQKSLQEQLRKDQALRKEIEVLMSAAIVDKAKALEPA